MFLVGLTGGIGSGKTTVSNMLRSLKCPVIDADEIAREVVKPGTTGWKRIQKHFGPEAFLSTGELDRKYVAKIIFNQPEKRQLLNSIIHPLIRNRMIWRIIKLFFKGYQFVILDIPLLFESGSMLPYIEYTLVVNSTEDQQIERLTSRNEFTKEEALVRIRAQISLNDKCDMATYIIDNSSSVDYTREQVERIHRYLRSSNAQWKVRSIFLVCFVTVTATTAAVCYYRFK